MQEGFVILEFDVKFGLLLLDQVTFQEKSFKFIIGDDEIQVLDVVPQDLGFLIEISRGLKIGTDTVLETLGLANVDHFPAWVFEEIDPRLIGKSFEFFLQHASIIPMVCCAVVRSDVCGLWSVVCGLLSVVCGLWSVVSCQRSAVS